MEKEKEALTCLICGRVVAEMFDLKLVENVVCEDCYAVACMELGGQ